MDRADSRRRKARAGGAIVSNEPYRSRIVWSDGTSRPDDYNIIHGDQIVGRMYRMNEPSSRTHAARKCPLASLECHKGAIGRPAAAEMEGGRKHAY